MARGVGAPLPTDVLTRALERVARVRGLRWYTSVPTERWAAVGEVTAALEQELSLRQEHQA